MLTERFVERVKEPGKYLDADGLYLQVRSPSDRYWLLRYSRNGKGERWYGIGPVANWTLAEARVRAKAARQLLDDGRDPIETKRAKTEAERAEAASNITFKQAAEQFLTVHENGWRNKKHRAQWRTTLKDFVYPTLGDRPVKALDAATINSALAPIWAKIPSTAARTKNRIERVLRWIAEGKPLPTSKASQRTAHHPALPFAAIPAFMRELRADESIAARALEFTVLTAARTGETIGAKWSEFDLEQKLWIIPASRMKAGRQHRTPLSDRAIQILASLPREPGNPFVFVGSQKGKAISNSAMLVLMRTMRPGTVPHGNRSSFKTWASETTAYPSEIVEICLAHAVGNAVERAYTRTDLLEKRRRLMNEWSRYCASVPVEAGAVVPLRR